MSVTFVSHVPQVKAASADAKSTALEIIGGVAESYAKAACPVDTGRLRNSITHQQESENVEVIGTNVEYAAYVELGTVKMAARPYLRPAAENHAGEYQGILKSVYGSG